MARILIAGCGKIGCELGAELTQQGHTVFGVRRNTADMPSSIQPVEADLSHPLSELPDKMDYVVYAAAAGKHKDLAYFQAYVAGVKHVLDALKDQHIKRFIFVSSSSVFGQSDGENVNENSPTSDKSFSAKRLLEGENLVKNSGIPHTIVRFGGIYGPGRNHLIDMVRDGKAHCMEGVYSNRIHSADCVGILKHLIESDISQSNQLDSLYIGVDSQPTLLCEVYEWLAEQLNVMDIEHVEPTENSRILRSNKRLSNQKIRDTGYQFQYPTYQDGYKELI